MRRSRADGLGRLFSARTTAARRGSRRGISFCTTGFPGRTSGMTGRRIRGSSSVCGTWNLRYLMLTRCMPERKMLPYFIRRMAGRTGRSFRGCADMAQGPIGSRVRAGCVCIRSFSIRRRLGGFILRFRLRGRFERMMEERRGSRSTVDFGRRGYRIRMRRLVIASITLRCILHGRGFCSCSSSGM